MERFLFKNTFLIAAVCLMCIMPSCQNKEELWEIVKRNLPSCITQSSQNKGKKVQYDRLNKQLYDMDNKGLTNLREVGEAISIIEKQIALAQEMKNWKDVHSLEEIKEQHLEYLQQYCMNMEYDANAFFKLVRIIPQSKMLFAGSPFEADVIVAAYDSQQTPEVGYRMGGSAASLDAYSWNSLNKVTDGKNGIVHLKIETGGIGDQSISGLIRLRKPDGEYDYYPFEDKFTVTRPMASISPAKMNVLYANIENPLIISAPVAPEKMTVTSTGGNVVSKGGSIYEIKPAAGMIGKEIEIKVSNRDGGGALGAMKFRVKKVPNPVAVVANKICGHMTKDELAAAGVVRAKKQDGFEFDLNWTITSYKVTITQNGKKETPIPVTGFRFPEYLKTKIKAASSGTWFEFTEIKASSPAGSIKLNDIVIQIR